MVNLIQVSDDFIQLELKTSTVDPVQYLFKQLQQAQLPWIKDLVISYQALGVFIVPPIDFATYQTYCQQILNITHAIDWHRVVSIKPPPKQCMLYFDTAQTDLEYIGQTLGFSSMEILEIFCQLIYQVAFFGFQFAFPYLQRLPHCLHIPRRNKIVFQPHAGAVCITAEQAGIFPTPSHTGWYSLGITDFNLKEEVITEQLCAGDRIQFTPQQRHARN